MSEARRNSAQTKVPVSVIIPTYDRSAYIVGAIESVLAQDPAPMEILVVDDGSTDDTRMVLEPYFDVIRYIRQDNRGVSAARNLGVREASAAYVTFLDSDDLFKPGRLKAQFAQPPAEDVLSFHGVEWFVDKPENAHLLGREKTVKWPVCDEDGYIRDPVLSVAQGCFLQIGSLMCSKQAFMDIGFFDETLSMGEDEDWFSRASMQKRFHYLPESYLRIRLHGRQTGMEREVCIRNLITVFENIKSRTEKTHRKASSVAARRLSAKWSHLANNLAKDGRGDEAYQAAITAFRVQPSNINRLLKAVLFKIIQPG